MRLRLAAALLLGILAVLNGFAGAAANATDVGPRGARTGADTDYGRMILVLDSSGSMKEPAGGGGSKIEAARSALDQVVGELPDEADVGLRVFGSTVFSSNQKGACTDSRLVVKPGTGNRSALRRAVSAYKPYGETPIGYALQQAAKDIGSEGKRSIVLVSDGEATCAPDPCEVAGELAAAGIDLQIDVVGLSVSGKAREQLQCIAEKGNGSYYDVDSADEITRSLSRVARRAVRPFTVSGRPIRGATSDAEPTPIAEGDWSDRLGPKSSTRGGLFYVYDRKLAGSTLRVSAVTPGDVGEWDGVEVQITPLHGQQDYACDIHVDIRNIDSTSVVGSEAVAEPDGNCGTAGKYLIEVSRWLNAPAEVPVAIRVSEEPPLRDTGSAPSEPEPPAQAPQVSGSAKAVLGGSSFTDATEVGTGRWSGDIVPGEAQMFRVPLDFGQHARVRFHFPEATPAVREQTGYDGPFVTMRTYNPMHAALGNAEDAKTTDSLPGARAADLVNATPVVSRATPISNGSDASLAGDYYMGISVAGTDSTYDVPYTLEVEVVDGDGGAPTYLGEDGWKLADALGQARSSADSQKEANGGSPTVSPPGSARGVTRDKSLSTPVKLAAVGGLGVVALTCLGYAVALLRRT